MNTNPLQQYFRNISEYITLPSGTSYYDDSVIEFNSNGEVGIMPMTAQDEIMLKNPDALLNGEAVVKMLQSCVPSLKKPKEMLYNDIEAIIVAIRKASFGETMDITTQCPDCNADNTYAMNLDHLLNNASKLQDEYKIELEKGLTMFLRPTTYENHLKANKVLFEQMRMARESEHKSADEKLELISKSYNNLAMLNAEVLISNVIRIKIDGMDEPVTNREHITEYMMNIPSSYIDQITELLQIVNSTGIDHEIKAVCQNCNHEWDLETNFEPTTFFTKS